MLKRHLKNTPDPPARPDQMSKLSQTRILRLPPKNKRTMPLSWGSNLDSSILSNRYTLGVSYQSGYCHKMTRRIHFTTSKSVLQKPCLTCHYWFRTILAVLILWALMPVERIGAATPEQIKAVAQKMVCLCGICNRESLATCMCSDFAVPQRQEIGKLLDTNKTHKEIIALYVQDFGSVILAAPPSTGYNLIAWIAPFAVLLFGIVIVRSVVRTWRHSTLTSNPTSNTTAVHSTDTDTADYKTRLQQELKSLDEET